MKIDDIVTLVVDGAEYDAKVEKVYDDQDYIDVRVIGGGPNAGVAYQYVNPKPAEGDSSKYFEKKTAAEQKAAGTGGESGTEDGPPQNPQDPAVNGDLRASAPPEKPKK